MQRVEIPSQELKRYGPSIDVSELFGRPHVYFLMRGFDVVYVGQTKTLSNRISDHYKSDKAFENIRAIPVELDELNAVESALIRVLKPEYNVIHASQPATENDRAIVSALGIIVRDKCLFETEPFKPYSYGLVSVGGRIGYYDDDEYECSCDEFYENFHLDMEAQDDKTINAVCKEYGCEKLAIIYFDGWLDGDEMIPYEQVLHLKAPGEQLEEEVFRRLLSHVSDEQFDEAVKNLGL